MEISSAVRRSKGKGNGIKSKSVGNGQYGTARWATKKEIQKTYRHVPYQPGLWRKDAKTRPKV
jgi:hypothetical protein